jgi:hypothetical protein
MTETFQIRFPDLSPTQAGEDAELLERAINTALREAGEAPVAKQTKLDMNTGDLGTIVEIVLAAPATIIFARGVAKAIQGYFARSNRAGFTLVKPDGTRLVVTDLESRDVEKVADKFRIGR